MKYLALIVIFGCLQAGVLAGPTQAPPSTAAVFQEAIARAQVALGNMTQQVSQALGVRDLSDSQNVINALASGTQNLANKVGALVGDLQKEVTSHSGDINGMLRSVTTRLNQTISELQTPEMQARAVQMRQQLENGLQSLISESRRLANAAASDLSNSQSELAKITNKALEEVVDTANRVQERIRTTIESAAPSAGV